MAPSVEERIHVATSEMLAEVHTKRARPLQKEAFLCSARCCDEANGDASSLQACVRSCETDVVRVSSALNRELGGLQAQLQRCLHGCQDSAATALGDERGAGALARAEKAFDACASKCADALERGVPAARKRVLAA